MLRFLAVFCLAVSLFIGPQSRLPVMLTNPDSIAIPIRSDAKSVAMRTPGKFRLKCLALSCVLPAVICLASAPLMADIAFDSVPASVLLVPNASFVTKLQVTGSNNSLGAFSVLIHYDPAAVQLVRVASVPGSDFAANLFVDTSSFGTGQT